jgi:photosystem II stability/assembly factor-like uncharacterized protein
MKKIYISLCLMMVSLVGLGQWFPLTSGTTAFLRSVHFLDASTGYAVGDGGTIIKTTNGGLNWSMLNSGTTLRLNSISLKNQSEIYVVGGEFIGISRLGVILNTTNNGINWSVNTIPDRIYYKVLFTNSNIGYTLSSYYDNGFQMTMWSIYKTSNGGNNWFQVRSCSWILYTILFLDPNIGFVTGIMQNNSIIEKTTDGGTSWDVFGTNVAFSSLQFTNFTTGNAVGQNGAIYKTTNGGSNWYIQTSGTTNALWSISFIDNDTGYVVGNSGTILKTTNGGSNWISETSGTSSNLNSVYFPDANTGYAVGANGVILKTTKFPWQPVTPTLSKNMLCINPTNSVFTTSGAINATSYIWEISPTSAGTISGNWLTGTVDWNDTYTGAAQITVKGHNYLGDGPASLPCIVNIYPLPPTPTITQHFSELTSSATTGNQWYRDGNIIPGATNQNYSCTLNGSYTVIVTINGCSSAPSNPVVIISVGNKEMTKTQGISVYPNPVTNELTIEITGNTEKTNFEILNSTGQLLYKGSMFEKTFVKTKSFAAGVYMIKFENGKNIEFRKMVKE